MNDAPPPQGIKPTEGEKFRSSNGEDYVFRNGEWKHVPFVPILSHMPMRDWFAGQALSGIIAAAHGGGDVVVEKVAKVAYHFADAMLAARAVKPEGNP